MILNRDSFDNPVAPDYILCKANGERIGNIICTSKTYDKKFNDISEIQFITYLNINNEKNPIYDAITEMKYIEVSEIGFFAISSVSTNSEGTEYESKTVTAKSYECLLAQKYLDTFTINYGTTESLDGVSFYNIADKSKSLLHLVLEKCPDWTIGHIDTSLMTMQRSFEVSRQDIYSFITTDIAQAFECFFMFDTLKRTINIYAEKNYGYDTNIHVSYNNLLKNTDITCSTDDIKTCLTITGSDDLTVREVNMGYDKIYNFDYYNSIEYMSQELYKAFNKWKNLRESKLDEYNTLLSQYQNYYIKINELTNTKMPMTPGSTNWKEYGLVPLQEQLSVYEQKQAVSMKAGHGETSSPYYKSEYLPIYNTIQEINNQISVVQEQINTLKNEQASIFSQMQTIINIVSMENNFTEEQLKELSTFVREDELSSDSFVVTDIMTDEERFGMLNQMLEYGEDELYKVATPQLSFSANMNNIFVIPDFDIYSYDFDVGNYIWVTLRDDYSIKAKLLTIHINYYDPSDFSVTFGNIVRKAKNIFTNVQDAINEAHSAATSVSFNQSYWNKASKDTDNINQMLADGLLSQGNYIATSTDNSDFLIDQRGCFVNTTTGTYANKDSIFFGCGRILFTDDNWKTVSMAVGRADVNGESRFGVFADFCIASYIAGSTIESSTITSTDFNNGNGTFHVDSNGNLVANSATVKGKIQADSGYIGGSNGFTIMNGKLYSSSKSAFSSPNAGVYVGTDGISLGKNNPFSVDSNGNLVANSGTIGGIKIGTNSIYSSNGNFSIDADGYGNLKDVSINGVRAGSSFGGVSYNGAGTYGNFGNGFYAGNSFGLNGGALTDFNNLVVNRIDANYVNTLVLNAGFVTADTVAANYATIGSLNANFAQLNNLIVNVDAKFNNLNANNITTGTLSTERLDIDGFISALGGKSILVSNLGISSNLSVYGTFVRWKSVLINGTSYTFLAAGDAGE